MSATFFYDLSSPYAYLAAERIDALLPDAVWEPIAFGPLLAETGRVPWSLKAQTRAEGIAEIERRAATRGLPPLRWAEGWPADSYSVMPPRAALWAREQGMVKEVSMALFRRLFVDGEPLNDLDTVLGCAREAGADAEALRAALATDELKRGLREATSTAIARGVVGVPTFAVGEELFWGDDRLEDAANSS